METIMIVAKTIIADRRFSAEGSNLLFNHITDVLEASDLNDIECVVLDFQGIDLVSTSFIGRFQTKITAFKSIHPSIKLRIVNLRPEIKRQFLRNDIQR